MYGALYVVENLEEYQADPDAYLAAHPPELRDELLKSTSRNTPWTYEELEPRLATMHQGRSFDIGKSLFVASNCAACHKLQDVGHALGPDLATLEPEKQKLEYLLMSILEPSKEIAERYQSHRFLLDTGNVVVGQIVSETPTTLRVLVDPLAKADPIEIEKDRIEEQIKSPVSIMPTGLLNKLTEEEILDLIAYVFAKGDPKHSMYQEHHHH